MNSATPGTLILYRFSPLSSCISSCPTISSPVTGCPFNVNLSPSTQTPCSCREFFPPQQQIVKKTISSFFWRSDSLISFKHLLSVKWILAFLLAPVMITAISKTAVNWACLPHFLKSSSAYTTRLKDTKPYVDPWWNGCNLCSNLVISNIYTSFLACGQRG